MSSLPEQTIFDFVDDWLPWQCSLCGKQGREIEAGYLNDPIYCWECEDKARPEEQQRLARVRAARERLGFENPSSYDLARALWPKQGRFTPAKRDPNWPPMFGYRFDDQDLGEQYFGEAYYLHGLSSLSVEELNKLHAAAINYWPLPAQPQFLENHRSWVKHWTGRDTARLNSEVLVHVGYAVFPKTRLDDYFLYRWQPHAPWEGYIEGPHSTAQLRASDVARLIAVGRKVFGIHFSGRPKGSGRFETASDLEQAVASAGPALSKQRRAITPKAVGAHLISKRGRNRTAREIAGDSHGDPGRQLREWCRAWGLNATEMIQRANVICDSQE